jgi:RimJ/RimL family protein N-acetyltransferase
LGWITSIRTRCGRRYADAGEVFWRETQAAGLTSEFGRLLLAFAFEECEISTLYGITPAANIPAVRFMKHCGFESFGPIPDLCCWNGETCDGYISAMTFTKWARRKNQP